MMRIIRILSGSLIFLLVIGGTVSAAQPLKVSIGLDEYISLTNEVLGVSEVQKILGSEPQVILYRIKFEQETTEAYVHIKGTTVLDASFSAPGDPDFIISLSRDAALSILNSHDRINTIMALLSEGVITINAANPARQAAINLAMATGVIKPAPVTHPAGFVTNRFGAPIGAESRNHERFVQPLSNLPVFFNMPPGVLAQSPGLVYDTVTQCPNVLGPHNVFEINPGLVGPNQILAQNPGLLGPADIGLLNPGLAGPREFAYVMGIGAHSNTAEFLQGRGLVNDPTIGSTNRWGNRR